MSAPTVPCPVCEAKGSLGFWGSTCKLCDGKAYLHSAPHKCPVCSGRGQRRLPGHIFESECCVCAGVGYTQKKMHPCTVCTNFKTRSFSWSCVTPCKACKDKRWVEGSQAECIICKGKGRMVPIMMGMNVSNSEAAIVGGVIGAASQFSAVILLPIGVLPAVAIGAMGGVMAFQRCTKACHGCKGATVRTDTQVFIPAIIHSFPAYSYLSHPLSFVFECIHPVLIVDWPCMHCVRVCSCFCVSVSLCV